LEGGEMEWKYYSVKAPQVDAGRELIQMADIKPWEKVLDIGCGTGTLTASIAEILKQGTVIGIDPSRKRLAQARGQAKGRPNMVLLQMRAELMDFDEQFDLAFSNSALQWIKEQEKVLSLVHSALKRGGRIAFQMPTKHFCPSFYEYVFGSIKRLSLEHFFWGWEPPWFLPEKEEYDYLLRGAGFRKTEVFYREYRLSFRSAKEILDWWASAGLRPFLDKLPQKERDSFEYSIAMGFEDTRTEKGLEFDFKRLFAFGLK
jgi:trans-aconitate 2-methyltransferase